MALIELLPHRIRKKVVFKTCLVSDLPGDCWIWTGAIGKKNGYVYVNWAGKSQIAHRVVYILTGHSIPPRFTLDHQCRQRPCLNPDHLKPLTLANNVMAGEGIAAKNARKTHCVNGHEFTPANTYRVPSTGHRNCLRCQQIHNKARFTPKQVLNGTAKAFIEKFL